MPLWVVFGCGFAAIGQFWSWVVGSYWLFLVMGNGLLIDGSGGGFADRW